MREKAVPGKRQVQTVMDKPRGLQAPGKKGRDEREHLGGTVLVMETVLLGWTVAKGLRRHEVFTPANWLRLHAKGSTENKWTKPIRNEC